MEISYLQIWRHQRDIMKIAECSSWCVILLLLKTANCTVTKRHLCVQFKKENYFVQVQHIENLHADTEHKCMVNCVRRYPCMAFNYHVLNKTCILMPELGCMTPIPPFSSRYLLVHLQPCKLQPPWRSVPPPESIWHWVITDDPNNNTHTVMVQHYFVSRTLYQGYYLLGWWFSDGWDFRAVEPVTYQVTYCTHGEFLTFSDPSSYEWIPYNAGDMLPNDALSISRLPDGTPLYLVTFESVELGNTVSGYYNHLTKMAHLVHYGAISPLVVNILCGK